MTAEEIQTILFDDDSDNCDDIVIECENLEVLNEPDNLIIEEIYDSDEHEEFTPEVIDEQEVETLPLQKKRVSPKKLNRPPSSGPTTSSISASTNVAAQSPNISRRRSNKKRGKSLQPDKCLHSFKKEWLRSRDGHRWSTQPQVPTQSAQLDTHPDYSEGPTNDVQTAVSPQDFLDLFFGDFFYSETLLHTNSQIKELAPKFKTKKATIEPATLNEIKALIGLLIMSGARQDNHVTTEEMWNQYFGAPLYRAAMRERRFCFLIWCLCFDNKDTRDERKKTDWFAAIRTIWTQIIDRCKQNYNPGENITVDKQLLAFRGRCPFRMYIANKPAKYGVKLFMACDVNSKYMLNAIPYLGSNTNTPAVILPGENITTELVKPYFHTGRTITTDNWFTSYSLTIALKEKKLKLVGTLGKKPARRSIRNARNKGPTCEFISFHI
ncbi:piggyBac transposable element-derived protein 4-like [Macrobrachium rosenbergii]|uniref:piggyBac transposable element-derived protein 4-like n=1 Tax=Macrobrachium rosenbergii TaxID=79674 RepID=UPI0034D79DA8